MALKAGYKGIKKNVLDSLMSLLGAKAIKTIGNGLSLSDAGALAADIDTDTMEFKDGKLASKSTGGVKYKAYKGKGGSETVITLDDEPSHIIGVYEMGTHSGYTGFLVGFGSGACKSVWVTPTNNVIGGVDLTYSINDNVLTITGGAEASQRADVLDADYVVLYV